ATMPPCAMPGAPWKRSGIRYAATTRVPSRRNRSCSPLSLVGEQPKQPPSSGKLSSTPSGAGTTSRVPQCRYGGGHHRDERMPLGLRQLVVELDHLQQLRIRRQLDLLEVRSNRSDRRCGVVRKLQDLQVLHEASHLVGQKIRLELLECMCQRQVDLHDADERR